MLIRVKKRYVLTIIAALATLFAPSVSRASYNNYTLPRIINVGLLRVPGTTVPTVLPAPPPAPPLPQIETTETTGQSGANPTDPLLSPYIFDILNNRPDVKPALWKLENPLAPPIVTSEIASRYASYNGGVAPYVVGTQITPNMAPYWDVDLGQIASVSPLLQFNLLVIRTDGPINLTLNERQILRQYVDQGGTLWFDGHADTSGNGSFWPSGVLLNGSRGGTTIDYVPITSPVTPATSANLFQFGFGQMATVAATANYHPLANSPFAFSPSELGSLGYAEYNGAYPQTICRSVVSEVGQSSNGILTSNNAPDPTLFEEIGTTALYAGDFGQGHVVVDSQGISDWINADGGSVGNYQGTYNAGTTYSVGQSVSFQGILYQCIAAPVSNSGVPQPQIEPDTDQYNASLTPYHHTYWYSGLDPVDAATSAGASTSNLEFLVNVLSLATGSANAGANVRGNNSQAGNLAGALSTSWQWFFPTSSGGPIPTPVGVATYGKFVYTTDSTGVLRCFDINPPESLFSDAVNGDDGFPDYSLGSSYDMIWQVTPSTGVALSPPTVATIPIGGVNREVVLVEDANGIAYAYPADYDSADTTTPPTALLTLGTSSGPFTVTPPGVTYYRGQLLVPSPATGAVLNIYNAPYTSPNGENSTYSIQISPGGGVNWEGTPVLVASVPSTDTSGYAGDEIVGYAPTSAGIQTFELGSRDEQLQYVSSAQVGTTTNTTSQFNSRISQIPAVSSEDIIGAPEDTDSNATSGDWILDFNADNGGSVFLDFPATIPALSSSFTVDNVLTDTIYADYDIDLNSTTAPVRTLLEYYPANASTTTTGQLAGVAVGPDNIVYLTVNESSGTTGTGFIEAVREQAPANSSSAILWRFELNGGTGVSPSPSPVIDANGITYQFYGYKFVGAPVVGNNGVIYALAENAAGTNTVLMAFNANPQVGFTNTIPQSDIGGDVTLTQADEFGGTQDIAAQQYVTTGTATGTTSNTIYYQFTNFSPSSQSALAPSLYAPGTVSIEYNNASTPVQINTAVGQATPMLEWYTSIGVAAASAGPRMIGDYIYFGGTASTTVGATLTATPALISVYANPSAIGLTPDPGTRLIPDTSTTDYRFVQVTPSSVGTMAVPPVGTDKYIVTSGANGFEGLSYNGILIADSNRLIEVDPSGNATWTMDATQEGTNTPVAPTAPATNFTTPNSLSSVPLIRPSTVSQLSGNDFLIADSGNNRCVQVDATGTVLTQLTDSFGYTLIPQLENNAFNALMPSSTDNGPFGLEISSFNDPLHILPAGQPLTLNQPNSVVNWLTYEYANGEYPNGAGTLPVNPTAIDAHYLVADTGNNRILDIVDRYTQLGASSSTEYALATVNDFHYLNWISHTTDIAGRSYKYVGAEPILNNQSTSEAFYWQTPSGNPFTTPPFTLGGATNAAAQVINTATGIIGVVGDKYIPNLDAVPPTAALRAAAPPGYTPSLSYMSPVDQDSSGSSILLFNYTTGYPFNPVSGSAGYQTGLPVQLINSVAYKDNTGTVNIKPLHGLRSAVATVYSTTPASLGGFLIADDDGVFNGNLITNGSTTVLQPPAAPTLANPYPTVLDATYGSITVNTVPTVYNGWFFLNGDYQNMVAQNNALETALAPISGTSTVPYLAYLGTNLVAASAIELSSNNYLIVNRGAIANPNAPAGAGVSDNGFGGNVFVVHAQLSNTAPPVNTLGGPIIGRPANTGALSAPAFALRSF